MDGINVMIDTGSSVISAGFCGQELPTISIPNCISETRCAPNQDVCPLQHSFQLIYTYCIDTRARRSLSWGVRYRKCQ